MNRSFKIFRPSYPLIFLIFLSSAISQNKYHSYDEMVKAIEVAVSSHKDIAKVESIGQTIEKRDIWVVTIGGKDADSRHAVLIVGGAEADRLIGSELTLRFIEFLTAGYGKVDSITQLVNTATFYIIPRVSPDASEAFFRKPLYARTMNARPTDDDKDTSIDEDGFEDLNGDGLITLIRVKDNRGEWIPHPDDPRVMKKAETSKGEQGIYKLFTEGIDNDKDEQWNEDEPGGVDFNRNFPHNYQFFSRGTGPYQISEPETKAVADFCFSHANIAVVFTYSSNDNLMNPWKKEPRQGPPQEEQRTPRRRMIDDEEFAPRLVTSVMDGDEEYTSYVSSKYQEITKLKGAPQSTKGEGAFNEWTYYHFGRWSFAANPWWIPEIEQKKDTVASDSAKMKRQEDKKGPGGDEKVDIRKGKSPEEKPDEYADQLKTLKWIDANKMDEAFIPWAKISDKDFPDKEVEVGGFKPYVTTNPPGDSIEVIALKQNSFLAWLGTKLPKIEIRNVRVEPIGGKVFRLTTDIANTGYLPTNSAIGDKARWSRNVRVTLNLSKHQSLGSGKTNIILEPIKGNGGRQEITWLIVSSPEESVTITAESPVAGSATQTVTLK